jgi:recombination protein RecT
VSGLLEKYKPQIAAALPGHMTPERMIRIALTMISQSPLLQKCNANTLCGAVVQASILGLEPNSVLGECYIIPYFNSKANCYEAQLQVGYKGHCKLARNSGEIAMIDAQAVRAHDDFTFEKGDCPALRHKWAADGTRGDIIGYWAGFRTKTGEFNFEYWTLAEVYEHRDRYCRGAFERDKSGKLVLKNGKPVLQGAWADSPDWMAKKTVLIQVLKLAPKSVQMQQAINLDETADRGAAQYFAPQVPLELQPAASDETPEGAGVPTDPPEPKP